MPFHPVPLIQELKAEVFPSLNKDIQPTPQKLIPIILAVSSGVGNVPI